MTADRLERVRQLFADAMARDPRDRDAFLRQACGDDEELRAEIESLLSARREMGSFLETPATEGFVSFRPSRLAPGDRVGTYEVLGVLGAGGNATVYEALQQSPRRRVALKVMHADLCTDAALRRFRDESEILARLNHADIAHVYEAGIHEANGHRTPWFALEFVESGRNVLAWAEESSLDVRARLDLVARFATAIHHGHQKGIVHRDIKPDNLLVDGSGRPKVIDFGIAAITGLSAGRAGPAHEIAGTLPYMSPEQCRLLEGDVDVRSDVYALGVLLYELLTGRLPHEVSDTPMPEAARRIREDAPMPIAKLDRSLKGDVERIVSTALARDRADRYQSAADLSRDIRRYLEFRPIAARRSTPGYQFRLFARRRSALLVTLVALVVVLVGGSVAATLLGWRAERSRREAVVARDRERMQSYIANLAAADAALRVHDVAEARRRLRAAAPGLRGWEWTYLEGRLDGSRRTYRNPTSSPFRHLAVAPDGARMVAAALEWYRISSMLLILDLREGEVLVEHGPVAASVRSPVWSPDGSRLAWFQNGGVVVIADAGDLERTRRWTAGPEELGSVAFHPDGESIVTSSESGRILQWDLENGELISEIADERTPITDVGFDPAGERLATCGPQRKTLRILDLAGGAPARSCEGHREGVLSLEFSPDGKRIVSGSLDGTLRIWSAVSAREELRMTRDREPVLSVAFSPTGDRILSGHPDGTINVWDAASGEPIETLWGHTDRVDVVVWGADGETVHSASEDGTVKSWRLGAGPCVARLGTHEELVRGLSYSPDGSRLACASFDDTVRIYDPTTGEELAVLTGHEADVQTVAFAPDSLRLVTGALDATVRVWDLEDESCRLVCRGHATGILAVAISEDGTRMASGSTDHSAIVWDAASGKRLHTLAHPSWVWSVAFSPGGKQLMTADAAGFLRFWSLDTGREIRTIRTGDASLCCAIYNADGSKVICAGQDGTLRIHEVETGLELAAIEGFEEPASALAVSPDGSRLLACGGRSVRLWDMASGLSILSLRGHRAPVYGVAFHPDGTQIATGGGGWAGEDCCLRLWGRVPGQAWPVRER